MSQAASSASIENNVQRGAGELLTWLIAGACLIGLIIFLRRSSKK